MKMYCYNCDMAWESSEESIPQVCPICKDEGSVKEATEDQYESKRLD